MGKQTKRKQLEREANEVSFQERFVRLSGETRARIEAPTPPLADELAGYHDRIIREIEGFHPKTKSDNRNKQLLLLVRHAFVKFKPPAILEQAWQAAEIPNHAGHGYNIRQQPLRGGQVGGNPNLRLMDFKDWYIAAATGESLYKTRARGTMTKAETHWFSACPHSITIPQALYYAVSKAAGATEGQALRVARSKLHERSFQDEFWRDCARFFSQSDHHPASMDQLNDLIDYLASKHQETSGWGIFGGGHTLASLLRKMHDWHYALRRLKVMGDAQWEGHALNDDTIEQKIDGKPCFWDFKQIKNTKDLAAEGTAMRHCVFGYKHSCLSGACSIWSLRLRDANGDSKRRVTIEVRDNGEIVQKRGLANRSCRPEELHAINQWARNNGLFDR